MNRNLVTRGIVVCLFAAGLMSMATPALAQAFGTLTGKVVDEAGKPVPDAEMVFEYVGDYKLRTTAKTNAKGEWAKSGLQATAEGYWNITVTKGDMGGRARAKAGIKEVIEIPNIVLAAGGAKALTAPPETKEEAAARALAGTMNKIFTEADAALAANNPDGAITLLTTATTSSPTCAPCFLRLGSAYAKKPDLENAEKAMLKSIELDPKLASGYDALATLYNQQKKFEEAGKMSAKASELHGASGGGDATSSFNSGVIFWNQGKIAEAKVQFENALKLNSKMAEAYYYFGMCLVNEGKNAEAKVALQQYLTLAPSGPNAATAKLVVGELK